jgi:competence protein CoiA
MKFALINGQRQEAQPNLSGQCPACDQAMIAKCGNVKVWHWAHKGRRICDPWWENETEWHRAWKGQFPESWQEVVHKADNGKKHIADVKTDQGWVIEFQHSPIEPEERRSRDTFYPKLVWVVDGARRKRDRTQFQNALNMSIPTVSGSPVRRIFSDKCVLLEEWAGCRAPVFFDFGGENLCWLLSKSPNGPMYVALFSRSDFIEIHRSGEILKASGFDDFVKDISKLVAQYESSPQAQPLKQAPQLPLQSLRRMDRRRRRL